MPKGKSAPALVGTARAIESGYILIQPDRTWWKPWTWFRKPIKIAVTDGRLFMLGDKVRIG